MGPLRALSVIRRRLDELASSIDESREASRAALDELRVERVSSAERHRELHEHISRMSAEIAHFGQWLEAVAGELGKREDISLEAQGKRTRLLSSSVLLRGEYNRRGRC